MYEFVEQSTLDFSLISNPCRHHNKKKSFYNIQRHLTKLIRGKKSAEKQKKEL
jgi:hypothetical protein